MLGLTRSDVEKVALLVVLRGISQDEPDRPAHCIGRHTCDSCLLCIVSCSQNEIWSQPGSSAPMDGSTQDPTWRHNRALISPASSPSTTPRPQRLSSSLATDKNASCQRGRLESPTVGLQLEKEPSQAAFAQLAVWHCIDDSLDAVTDRHRSVAVMSQ